MALLVADQEGLLEWIPTEVAKACFPKIAAPNHHKSHFCKPHHKLWLQKLDDLYKKRILANYPAMASRVWKCDETDFNTVVGLQQALAKRGSKMVHKTGGGSDRENITVHICGYAGGDLLPSYTVYKAKH